MCVMHLGCLVERGGLAASCLYPDPEMRAARRVLLADFIWVAPAEPADVILTEPLVTSLSLACPGTYCELTSIIRVAPASPFGARILRVCLGLGCGSSHACQRLACGSSHACLGCYCASLHASLGVFRGSSHVCKGLHVRCLRWAELLAFLHAPCLGFRAW